jgi:DNA-binding MurR/RpiR family transcriptional regulator
MPIDDGAKHGLLVSVIVLIIMNPSTSSHAHPIERVLKAYLGNLANCNVVFDDAAIMKLVENMQMAENLAFIYH